MRFLSDQDIGAITQAIRIAEARTSGEIVTVVAAHSDSYLWPVSLVAALAAFLVPGLLAAVLGIVSSGDLFFIQLATLLGLEIVLSIAKLRFALIPASIKRANARRRAHEQFFERRLHLTQNRIGVLIFVSVAERYVEIVADAGIAQKVEADTWNGIVDEFVGRVRQNRVTEGFLIAIQSVGDILARHFPSATKNPNELPDRLFVI